jgi:hypothetical protein
MPNDHAVYEEEEEEYGITDDDDQEPRPPSKSQFLPSHCFHINLVDLNGIHGAKVQYCRCKSGWKELKSEQLLQAGFFPATPKDPGTAFSFQLMKHYQNHSPVLYQFAEGLRKDTDSALPSDIPVRRLSVHS